MSIGQELLNVPFPEMVGQLAGAIAEGQYKLDMVSCKIAAIMGDAQKSPVQLPDVTNNNETITTSLIGAGFQPTFYQFTDTIIEVKIDITITNETEYSVDAGWKCGLIGAHVNAKYSNKYSYTANGSSLLRTKITPVPPSTFMQKLLDMKAQMIQQEFQLQIKKMELELAMEQKKLEKEMEEEEAKAEESSEAETST